MKPGYNEAVQSSIKNEQAKLEAKILSDLKDLMAEAYCVIVESKILDKFREELKGKHPTITQISNLREDILFAVLDKNPKFENHFNLIVERSKKNKAMVEVGIDVRADLFK